MTSSKSACGNAIAKSMALESKLSNFARARINLTISMTIKECIIVSHKLWLLYCMLSCVLIWALSSIECTLWFHSFVWKIRFLWLAWLCCWECNRLLINDHVLRDQRYLSQYLQWKSLKLMSIEFESSFFLMKDVSSLSRLLGFYGNVAWCLM